MKHQKIDELLQKLEKGKITAFDFSIEMGKINNSKVSTKDILFELFDKDVDFDTIELERIDDLATRIEQREY